jgi:hypothetical protein
MNAELSGRLDELMPSASARRSVGELRFVVAGAYVADCFIDAERLPLWGEEYEAGSIRTTPGGKALNQAVALARLGARVNAVGVVGDAGLGRDIVGALARERVDVSWMESREDVATAICLCFVSGEGESSIVWHIDEAVALTPSTVRAAASAFERADALLTTFEIPVPAICEAIASARYSGARVFVQPAPVLADPTQAVLLPWDQVDVLRGPRRGNEPPVSISRDLRRRRHRGQRRLCRNPRGATDGGRFIGRGCRGGPGCGGPGDPARRRLRVDADIRVTPAEITFLMPLLGRGASLQVMTFCQNSCSRIWYLRPIVARTIG